VSEDVNIPIEGGAVFEQPGQVKGSTRATWLDKKGNKHSVTYRTDQDHRTEQGKLDPSDEQGIEQTVWKEVCYGDKRLYIHQGLSVATPEEQERFAEVFFLSREDTDKVSVDTGALYKERETIGVVDEVEAVFKEHVSGLIMGARLQESGVSKLQKFSRDRKIYTIECCIEDGKVKVSAKVYVGKGNFKTAKKVVVMGASQDIELSNTVQILLKLKNRKDISPEKLREFKDEANMHLQLTERRIPHIVRAHKVVTKDGKIHGILVESCGVGDCSMFASNPPPERPNPSVFWPDCLKGCLHIAEALEGMHKEGICHNDVKPANAMIGLNEAGEFDIKLSDFGLTSEEGAPLPQTDWRHASFETLHMMSKGEGVATKENDVRALGSTIFEMTHGEKMNSMNSMPSFPPTPEEYDVAVEALLKQLDISNSLDGLLYAIFTKRVTSASEVVEKLREIVGSPDLMAGLPGMDTTSDEETSFKGTRDIKMEKIESIHDAYGYMA